MPFFRHEGHRLAYTVHGEGPHTCVLVHGLLLSQKMHRPLAAALAERGIAVRRFPQGRLGIIPALDQIEPAAHALGTALRELG